MAGPAGAWKCSAAYGGRDLAEPARIAAERAIKRQLKDPESARFGPELYTRVKCQNGATDLVCMKVSARNSYGGYASEKLWLYAKFADGTESTWTEDDLFKPANAGVVDALALCAKNGAPR